MKRLLAGLGCVVWLFNAACADAAALPLLKKPDPAQVVSIPWEELSETAAALAKKLMDNPTVAARGQPEVFGCVPEQYQWLLDNPERAVDRLAPPRREVRLHPAARAGQVRLRR